MNIDSEIPTLDYEDILSEAEIPMLRQLDLTYYNSYRLKETEIELRIGLPLAKFGGQSNLLNYAQFNTIKEFFGELDKPTISKTLDIQFYRDQKVDSGDDINNLRFTLKNPNIIGEYCRTNNLPNKLEDYSIIYKGDMEFVKTPDVDTYIRNTYNIPQNIPIPEHNYRFRMDLESYKIRIGGKLEIPYNPKSKKFVIDDILSPHLQELQKKASKALEKLNTIGAKNCYKVYRLKDRLSYMIPHKKLGIIYRIDLTKVKTNSVVLDEYGNEIVQPVKTFIESGIVEEPESYEFEVEVLPGSGQDVHEPMAIANGITNFIELFYLKCMSNVNGTPGQNFVGKKVQDDIISLYHKATGNLIRERIQLKLDTIDQVQYYKGLDIESDIAKEMSNKYITSKPYSYFNMILNSDESYSAIKDRLNNNLKKLPNKPKFISPKVVSINMNHVRPENPKSIQYGYTVTDKADGVSMLLFKIGQDCIDQEQDEKKREYYQQYLNNMYLIDSNLRVADSNIIIDFDNKTYLFNGEYLHYGKDKHRKLQTYALFDSYIYNSKDCAALPLVSNDTNTATTRIALGQMFIDKLTPFLKFSSVKQYKVKTFYIADSNISIFAQTKRIWDNYNAGNTEYKLDGVIYTPKDMPVEYDENDPYYDLRMGQTWTKNLKWKPPADNTIDFLLRFEKVETAKLGDRVLNTDRIKEITKNDSNGSVTKQYKVGHLYVGSNSTIVKNPCLNKKTNVGDDVLRPKQFYPKHPLDEEVHNILLELKAGHNGERAMPRDLESDPIVDESIVECSYSGFNMDSQDYIANKAMRWSVLRTRHDKTFDYKNGLSKQKLIYKKIQKCLELVNKPFNPKTKDLFKSVIGFVDRLPGVNRDSVQSYDKYEYSLFQKFANTIKSRITSHEDIKTAINFGNFEDIAENIWMSMHNPITPEIITTGQGIPEVADEESKYYSKILNEKREKSITIGLQDFHNKFIKNKLLLNNVATYLKSKGEPKISLLDLACGKGSDIAKWRDNGMGICVGIDLYRNNIMDENDGACERYNFYKSQSYLNTKLPSCHFLVGDVTKNILNGNAFVDDYSKQLFNNLWNPNDEYNTYFKNHKFHIISIMFALHYFFKNKVGLDNFIENINDNLKPGGFMIGACFDGEAIFKMLEKVQTNDFVAEYSGGKLVWKIIKSYKNSTFSADDQSIGVSIKVLIYSINQIIEEYLVSFEYFLQRCKEIGIEVLSQDVMKHMNIPTIDGTKKSVGSFSHVYDYLSTIPETSVDFALAKDIRTKLTDVEKKLSFLNSYFILQKRTVDMDRVNKYYTFIYREISQNRNVLYMDLVNKGSWDSVRDKANSDLQDTIENNLFNEVKILLEQDVVNGKLVLKQEKKKIVIKKPAVLAKAVVEPKPSVVVPEEEEEKKENINYSTMSNSQIYNELIDSAKHGYRDVIKNVFRQITDSQVTSFYQTFVSGGDYYQYIDVVVNVDTTFRISLVKAAIATGDVDRVNRLRDWLEANKSTQSFRDNGKLAGDDYDAAMAEINTFYDSRKKEASIQQVMPSVPLVKKGKTITIKPKELTDKSTLSAADKQQFNMVFDHIQKALKLRNETTYNLVKQIIERFDKDKYRKDNETNAKLLSLKSSLDELKVELKK